MSPGLVPIIRYSRHMTNLVNLVCTPTCSRIMLTVAMETIQIFIMQTSLSLRTKIIGISLVQMNDLAPMKKLSLECKVRLISSRCTTVFLRFFSESPCFH